MTPEENIYVSYDLGTSNVTMTIIENKDVESHYLEFKPDLDPIEIYNLITHFIVGNLSDYIPHSEKILVVYIESVFGGLNHRTFSRMTMVAHDIYLISKRYTPHVEYIEPASWRKHLFGKGNKKKLECQEWAYENYPFLLEYPKKTRQHRADSLMVGLGGAIRHVL